MGDAVIYAIHTHCTSILILVKQFGIYHTKRDKLKTVSNPYSWDSSSTFECFKLSLNARIETEIFHKLNILIGIVYGEELGDRQEKRGVFVTNREH